MGTTKGVLPEPAVDTGDNDLAGDLVGVVVRKWATGLAGMGTGRWTAVAPPFPPLSPLEDDMMLSMLKELTRPPPPPPLFCLGGEAAAANKEAGLPAPPPSLELPRLSVLRRPLLMLGDPLSKSRSIERFLGDKKLPPSLTASSGW